MPRKAKARAKTKRVETLKHRAEKRKNIPTAELQSYLHEDEAKREAERASSPLPSVDRRATPACTKLGLGAVVTWN